MLIYAQYIFIWKYLEKQLNINHIFSGIQAPFFPTY